MIGRKLPHYEITGKPGVGGPLCKGEPPSWWSSGLVKWEGGW